jgi:hypothetical protein
MSGEEERTLEIYGNDIIPALGSAASSRDERGS